jgi:hypothetical protein
MSAMINIGSVTLPAGEYWVGDPCYAIPDDRWMEWLEAADYRREPSPRYLVADLDGHSCVGVGTAYGDGVFHGSDGNNYPVDAGLIGAVPVEVCEGAPRGMHLMSFAGPFDLSYHDGVIKVGNVAINTDPDDDWDEEDDEDPDDPREEWTDADQ